MAKRRSNGGGSVTKKKDKNGNILYYARISLPTGKRIGKYFTSDKEAQKWLTSQLSDIQKGTFVEPTKTTLKEWMLKWLNDYMKISCRQTTWESYQIMIEKHILPDLGPIKLAQLQTSNLQKLYNDKLTSGRADGKPGGLAPKTVRYIHTIIYACLEQAVKEKILMINPAAAAKLPKNPKKEMKILDSKGVQDFIKAAKEYRLYAAFYLEIFSGLRRGEVLGLRWKDVDFKAKTIEVVQQLVRTPKGDYIFQEPKTKLSKRKVIVPDEVLVQLKEHKKKQAQERKDLGQSEIIKPEDLVFVNELGKLIQPRNFLRTYRGILKKAGLDTSLRFHDLRHTFATLSLQHGVDIKTLQGDLGHHSAAFTLDQYSHVTMEMKQAAANKRSEFLKSIEN